MKPKWIILISFFGGILAAIIASVLVLFSGVINMGADVKPGFIEQTLAPWALDRSVEWHASKEKNPCADNPAAIAAGCADYRENCVMCHGAPDVSRAGLSKGLNPPAPPLSIQDDTPDGELFWLIKHGIRMTPMPAFAPTHSDEEIWKIVAFVRHLPALTTQERESLQSATAEKTHHRE